MLASTVQFSKNERSSPHIRYLPAGLAGGSGAEAIRSLKDTHVFSQDPTAYRSVHSALTGPFHADEPQYSLQRQLCVEPASIH
ncbi:hypothetical protein Lesp02_85620 [Lentzea sp. NBRC 105346]|nr:hypothetical protein Lesp02_85620 [Lentzea sp. NBRC 105346]